MTCLDMMTSDWHELVAPVLPHASTDKDLPELAAVRLEAGPDALYAVATDRYTLAAERWSLDARNQTGLPVRQVVHLDAREVAASLKLFTHSKDKNPPLRVIIDEVPVSVQAAGLSRSVNSLAVTIRQAGDGTSLVLRDTRDPARDPLAGWRADLARAMTRTTGRALDGLDLYAGHLARWTTAARKGERLTMYTGPEPGDPILVTVEEHFAGVWALPRYLDGPGRILQALPWHAELGAHGNGSAPAGVDLETGERLDDGGGEDGLL